MDEEISQMLDEIAKKKKLSRSAAIRLLITDEYRKDAIELTSCQSHVTEQRDM